LAIDLGLPVINVKTLLNWIAVEAGKSDEYNHEFYLKVKELLLAWDSDTLTWEKIV